jgi:hypothetical protein
LLFQYFVNKFFFLEFSIIANSKFIGNRAKLREKLCIQFFNIIHKCRLAVNLREARFVVAMKAYDGSKQDRPMANRQCFDRTGEQEEVASGAKPG